MQQSMKFDYADADLVTAIIKSSDHLKERAEKRRQEVNLIVPFSVGIELLFVAKKHDIPFADFMGRAGDAFELEHAEILHTAADALDEGDVTTVFDAIHAAHAFHDGRTHHTTDRKLLASPYPTRKF